MGAYQSTTEVLSTKSNMVAQAITSYRCAIEMAKQGKDSKNIIELINRNTIPINSTQEEYNEVINMLNDLLLTLASNEENNSEDVLKLDRIIGTIIYDRDHGPPELETEEDPPNSEDNT
tara:strand:- start:6517 stop:6873 length:357 start_codon:yes stop_codon:yes gene_type:complete